MYLIRNFSYFLPAFCVLQRIDALLESERRNLAHCSGNQARGSPVTQLISTATTSIVLSRNPFNLSNYLQNTVLER